MSFIFVAEGGLGKGTRNKEYRDTCRINSWKETYPENWEWFWMCLMEVLFSSRRSRTIYYLKEGRTYDILISLTGEGLLCTCDIKTSICNIYHIYVYIYMIYDICITCIYIQHFGLSSIPMIDTCCVFCMFWCWHSHSASKLTAGVARKPCQECRGEAKREAMMEVWGGGGGNSQMFPWGLEYVASRERSHIPPKGKRKIIDSKVHFSRGYVHIPGIWP